ncbi:plectin isoform X11 [Tachysurus ichikawai]
MASGNRERHRMLSLKEEGTSDRTPGDTLPWNLSKYQKVRRSKSASAEVLDPAERAVIRIAGGLYVNVSLTFLYMARLS